MKTRSIELRPIKPMKAMTVKVQIYQSAPTKPHKGRWGSGYGRPDLAKCGPSSPIKAGRALATIAK